MIIQDFHVFKKMILGYFVFDATIKDFLNFILNCLFADV